MVGTMMRRRNWRYLWLAIAGRRTQADAETVVEVALQDMDLAAFEGLDGRMAYGLQADQCKRRPLWRRRLREPVGL